MIPKTDLSKELQALLKQLRSPMASTVCFSFIINMLMLTGPLFMLQVYDRVLASGSLPTLFGLVLLVLILYSLYGFLEAIRARIMVRVGRVVDEGLRDRIFSSIAHHALARTPGVGSQPAKDLVNIRRFVAGPGPFVFLDVPWVPVYLGVIFLMHWVLGVSATIAVLALMTISILNDNLTKKPVVAAFKAASRAEADCNEVRQNIESATALGMVDVLKQRWLGYQSAALDHQTTASDQSAVVNAASRTLRLLFQSGMLAVGAWLAVLDLISAGTMIAASIILARALAPVEQMVAHWQSYLGFRRSVQRINLLLSRTEPEHTRMQLPALTGQVSVDRLAALAHGCESPIVRDISFELLPGDGLGIIGPTGAGKSTVAKALVGVWPDTLGEVRFDGATLSQWDPTDLGRNIGYLPQEVELFEGTIAQNISRFQADADTNEIIDAARAADIHEFILQFEDGYNTNIGEGGVRPSAGQRQRIGLARALYGRPRFIVMDEPNANLDMDGEAALVRAIKSARAQGCSVVVAAHRPSAIAALDTLMMLKAGRMVAYGPKDQVLDKVLAKPINQKSEARKVAPDHSVSGSSPQYEDIL